MNEFGHPHLIDTTSTYMVGIIVESWKLIACDLQEMWRECTESLDRVPADVKQFNDWFTC